MSRFADKHLHLVSFNVPYPADYGGVIDVFYKIRALHTLGVKIHLHCFHYGREQSEILEQFCASVNYYPRSKFYQAIYSSVPYIVGSRQSGELLSNLSEDDHPVIFEGLHTCLYLDHPALKNKLKAVRMHNVEWEYYRSLKEAERNYLLKFYYYTESEKLRKFEGILKNANVIFAISRKDTIQLSGIYDKVAYIPAFHSNESMDCLPGKGDFILYHGNLSVVENHQAAMFILLKLFPGIKNHRLIIAGRNPLQALQNEVKKWQGVELIENPSDETLYYLIRSAQINLLPTFQATGIRLKLLNALFLGRHLITNSKMVEQTGLESACRVEDHPEKLQRLINDYMEIEFSHEMRNERQSILEPEFSNRRNAEKLCELMFEGQPRR